MSRVEILCTTMEQRDFSLIEKMNIQCNVLFSNQTNCVGYDEKECGDFHARMISTQTRGVGKNRNISLIYAEGDILLFADDDMKYVDGYAKNIESEFERFPDADVIIFNIISNDGQRKQFTNRKSKRIHRFSRIPYGAPRIAIRKESWEKSNVWFTPLFGGGAKYSSGEDSVFLWDVRKKGLRIYVSSQTIGEVDMQNSTWFEGYNEQFFFDKGAYCGAVHSHSHWLWKIYYCIRIKSNLSLFKKMRSFEKGVRAYVLGRTFEDAK